MKRALKQVLIVVFSVFVVAYTVMQLFLSKGDKAETEHAFYSVVNDVIETSAYIFRDEKAVMQSGGGNCSYSVSNGEKVHLGQQLCVTYRDSDEAGVQRKINELNRRINLLGKSDVGGEALSADLPGINAGISECLLEIGRDVAAGDLFAAANRQDELLVQMNRRLAAVSGSGDYFKGHLRELEREKQRLESSLCGVSVVTNASASGYFYTAADGYERAFSVSLLDSVTAREFRRLVDSKPDGEILKNAVGKIVCGSKWYIAFVGNQRDEANFVRGRKYGVVFPYSADTEIQMSYEGAGGDVKDGETVLVFGTNTLPRGFNFTRKQQVKVVKKTMQGLKVRTAALVTRGGETGVYSLSSGRVVFKTAEVLCEDGGFYLVRLPNENNRSERSATKLSLHDAVLIGGKNIYVGKVM